MEIDKTMPKKKASSPRKRSTKAATQTRSTTSSTTAKPAKKKAATKKVSRKKKAEAPATKSSKCTEPAKLSVNFLKSVEAPRPLESETQYAYMTLLSRGASPAAACTQLGIYLADVIWTLEHDSDFASMVERVQELLSQNVAAALYRSAMEGSVSAQQNYLKSYPLSGNSATDNSTVDDPLMEMTEEELIDYLKAEAKAFLAELDQEGEAETEPVSS